MAEPSKNNIPILKALLVRAFRTGVHGVLKQFLRALKENRSVSIAAVYAIIDSMREEVKISTEKLAIGTFGKALAVNDTNLLPLLSMLKERDKILSLQIGTMKSLVLQGAEQTVEIGRRFTDEIRATSMNALERSFLQGQSGALGFPELRKELAKVKGVFQEDGQPPMITLLTKVDNYGELPPFRKQYMNLPVDYYASLVAKTTTQEADVVSNAEKAAEIGTRLVKWNSTGKDYRRLKDEACARIDGKVFSTIPGGVTIKGNFYPYWRDFLPAPFIIPHPHCRHFMRPITEAVATSEDLVAA